MGLKPDYKDFSDAQLVDQLRTSDALAFSEIFRRYRGILLLFTFRRIHDVEHSKDLIHDTFTDIWEKRATLNVPGALRPFLITVIKNRILDYYKHAKVSQRYLDNFDAYLKKHEDTTDHLLRQNELSARIEKEIAELPEKMRVVFELSRNNEMTRKEIADRLGIPQETVNSRMRHALKILKDKLGIVIFIAFIFGHNQHFNIILTFF